MKFLRLDLLTLLISLFILNSCKNNDTVGLPVGAAQQVNGTQLVYDNLTVRTMRMDSDSVSTLGLAKTPLAYFKDPILGITEANIQTGVDLPLSTAYTLPTGTITTDSAVLVLRYNDGFYGDSLNSDYKINVYQAKNQLTGSTFYSNQPLQPLNSTVVGTRSFKPYTHTVFKITSIVAGKPDTLIKVPAQLRVPISTSFIANNFWNAGSTLLANNTSFRSAIKGLYLTLDKNQRGDGGNIMFNLDSSHVDVYYKAVSGTTIDTSVVSLPITAVTHAAQIKHAYSTEVQTALNSTASNSTVYLQGMGGLKAKIGFPNLNAVFGTTSLNSIVLNRAELVITPKPGSFVAYVPQPKLGMYHYDIARQPVQLPDASTSSPYFLSVGIFNGYYTSSLQSYRFIITGYVQDLLRAKYPDYGTYIVPVDTTNTTTVDYLPTAQTAGRTVAGGTDKTSGYNIKLNIIYTKANK